MKEIIEGVNQLRNLAKNKNEIDDVKRQISQKENEVAEIKQKISLALSGSKLKEIYQENLEAVNSEIEKLKAEKSSKQAELDEKFNNDKESLVSSIEEELSRYKRQEELKEIEDRKNAYERVAENAKKTVQKLIDEFNAGKDIDQSMLKNAREELTANQKHAEEAEKEIKEFSEKYIILDSNMEQYSDLEYLLTRVRGLRSDSIENLNESMEEEFLNKYSQEKDIQENAVEETPQESNEEIVVDGEKPEAEHGDTQAEAEQTENDGTMNNDTMEDTDALLAEGDALLHDDGVEDTVVEVAEPNQVKMSENGRESLRRIDELTKKLQKENEAELRAKQSNKDKQEIEQEPKFDRLDELSEAMNKVKEKGQVAAYEALWQEYKKEVAAQMERESKPNYTMEGMFREKEEQEFQQEIEKEDKPTLISRIKSIFTRNGRKKYLPAKINRFSPRNIWATIKEKFSRKEKNVTEMDLEDINDNSHIMEVPINNKYGEVELSDGTIVDIPETKRNFNFEHVEIDHDKAIKNATEQSKEVMSIEEQENEFVDG